MCEDLKSYEFAYGFSVLHKGTLKKQHNADGLRHLGLHVYAVGGTAVWMKAIAKCELGAPTLMLC